MKTRKFSFCLTIFVSLALAGVLQFASPSTQKTQSAEALLGAALHQEEVEGNLEAAIETYKKFLAQHGDNKSLAAKAQLHIGICYEKLGLREAQNAYQSVIDNYPQQIEAVKLAQQRLANLLKARDVTKKGDIAKNLRLVWAGPDVEVTGAPSPDGRYISYTDWNTGNLAVYEIPTQKKWPLTGNKTWDGSYALNSRWSPDGKKVAYDWWNKNGKEGELRIIGLDGSGAQILIDACPGVLLSDWSPDGKHILAAIYTDPGAFLISLISVAEGSIKTLKKTEWSEGKMRFSPDGKSIAFDFQSRERADSDIYLLSIDGKTELPLVQHPANDYLLGWTSNGKHLLFASDRTGTFDAWILPVSDGKPQGEPEIVRKNLGYVHPLGITRNGALYYASSSGIQSIFVAAVDPETCLSTAPIKKMSLPFEGRNSNPEFSPDGQKIAFVRSSLPQASVNTLQAPNFLCIRSLEDGRERDFPLNRHVYYLRWAPDSLSILVSGMDQEKRVGFTRLDANTGEVTTIAQSKSPATAREGFFLAPEWSNNGKALVYLHYDLVNSVCPIMYQNLETGQTKKLHQLDLKNRPLLTISPDKKWLAILEQPRNTPSEKTERIIKIIPAEGGESRELCRFQNETDHMVIPRWSADGQFVLYPNKQSEEKFWELWRVPFKGGQPQKTGVPMTGGSNISPHPDGRQIAFTSQGSAQSPAEIWIMENFLPKNDPEKKQREQ